MSSRQTLESLILWHLQQLLKLEAQQTRLVLDIYRKQIPQLAATIALEPGDTIAYARMRVLLAQLEAGVKLLEEQVNRQLVIGVVKAQALSIEHAGDEVAFAEKLSMDFGRVDLGVKKAALDVMLAPIINTEALVMVQQASKLSTARWAAAEISTIQGVLQRGILMSAHPKQIARDLERVLDPGTRDWEITRIAQTEFWQGANTAHRVSNEAISERYPELGLEHVWCSRLDSKVCPMCRRLDGLTVVPGDNFTDPAPDEGKAKPGGGWLRKPQLNVTWRNPPAHPWCRCRIATWSSRWADVPELASLNPHEQQKAA